MILDRLPRRFLRFIVWLYHQEWYHWFASILLGFWDTLFGVLYRSEERLFHISLWKDWQNRPSPPYPPWPWPPPPPPPWPPPPLSRRLRPRGRRTPRRGMGTSETLGFRIRVLKISHNAATPPALQRAGNLGMCTASVIHLRGFKKRRPGS